MVEIIKLHFDATDEEDLNRPSIGIFLIQNNSRKIREGIGYKAM
jgi:hypothetical protein